MVGPASAWQRWVCCSCRCLHLLSNPLAMHSVHHMHRRPLISSLISPLKQHTLNRVLSFAFVCAHVKESHLKSSSKGKSQILYKLVLCLHLSCGYFLRPQEMLRQAYTTAKQHNLCITHINLFYIDDQHFELLRIEKNKCQGSGQHTLLFFIIQFNETLQRERRHFL